MHVANVLLVTAVYVKMKLGDNTWNNERLLLVKKKRPIYIYIYIYIYIIAISSPFFTALQCINNLKTQRSPKTTLNLENLNLLKKSI